LNKKYSGVVEVCDEGNPQYRNASRNPPHWESLDTALDYSEYPKNGTAGCFLTSSFETYTFSELLSENFKPSSDLSPPRWHHFNALSNHPAKYIDKRCSSCGKTKSGVRQTLRQSAIILKLIVS